MNIGQFQTAPRYVTHRTCPHCGRDFVVRARMQKYCSDACRAREKAERDAARRKKSA